MSQTSRIPRILAEHEAALLAEWTEEQASALRGGAARISEAELRREAGEFLALLRATAQTAGSTMPEGPAWAPVHELLAAISRSRAQQGFSPAETATFVLSLKRPLFTRLASELAGDTAALAQETWNATLLLDRLGLFTTESYQRTREEVIRRQQQELLELSTPVVKIWDGVLAVPLIGTLDSERTQVVMENLLQRIVETGAQVAIVDITGVPTVDTLVAQHLIKTVQAARLMGADCVISGIRPQIAQTMVHLGIVLQDVVTKATLADAIAHALRLSGLAVTRQAAR